MDKVSKSHFFNFFKQPIHIQNNRGEVTQSPQRTNRANESNVSFNGNGVIAAKVVFQSISQQFNRAETVNNKTTEQVDSSQHSLFDVDEVVKTIFDFVNSGIAKAKDSGASDKELETMFSQAQEGVNRGLDEALTELEELSMLTEDIKTGIAQTRSVFEEKLSNLKENYFSEEASTNIQNQEYISAGQSYGESSVVELVTKEGDKVSISFSQQQSTGFSLSQVNSDNSFTRSLALEAYSSKSFTYTIEGELSDDEKEAIGNLVSQIAEVQESFFGNNIEEAFQRVSAMNVDFNQISSVAFELTQTQTLATQSYNSIANMESEKANLAAIKDDISQLTSFMEQLQNLQNDAEEKFNVNKGQLVSLMNAMFKEVYEPDSSSADVFNRIAKQLLQDEVVNDAKPQEVDEADNEKAAQ